MRAHLAALALRDDEPAPLASSLVIALLALHLFGIAAFWRLLNQPLWLAPVTLAILLIVPAM